MSTETEQMLALQKLAHEQLQLCSSDTTPVICETIKTSEGHETIMRMIINRIMSKGYTISEAITEIEKDYDVNRIND